MEVVAVWRWAPNLACKGANGSPSVFQQLRLVGGGLGGEFDPGNPGCTAGDPGGMLSGGGGGDNNGPSAKGNGNSPPVSPAQGNNGGDGCVASNSVWRRRWWRQCGRKSGGSPATTNAGGIGVPTNIAPASGTTG